MLRHAKQDLKQNYYDPTFHGLDIEKVFADAEARLREATTSAEATAILADPLLKLDDSHTRFYPPERLAKTDYGWTAIMIGDDPYVGWVRKTSDAESKGLARGDRILHWNTLVPSRSSLWQINYVYRHVRPQQLQRLVVRKPDGSERVIDVESKVERRPAGDLEQLIRETEDAYRTPIDYEKATGDILVVALSEFGDPKAIERFMQMWGVARSLDAEVRTFRLRGDRGWEPDWEEFERAVTSDTRLLYLSNPNNPTGSVLSDAAMQRIVDRCERTGTWLLSDEVYLGAEIDGPRTKSFWDMRRPQIPVLVSR